MSYISEFKSIKNNKIKIEISSSGSDSGNFIYLTDEEPVVIEYESGDIFKPLKQSSCNIQAVVKNPLLDVYTGEINGVKCKVYRDDKLFWYGFLTPNVYSSPFNKIYDNFSCEFIDVIAQLDNVKFLKTSFYKSFLDYIKDGVGKIDNEGVIKSVFVQEDSKVDIETMGVAQRNFYDESGDAEGAMTYKEVFESILSFMGMTMVYFGDALYIYDPQTVSGKSFDEYSINGGGATCATPSYLDLYQVGIFENSAEISLGNIYNKIVLVANNNPIGIVLPDVFDDECLVGLMGSQEYMEYNYKIRTGTGDDEKTKTYKLLKGYYKNTKFQEPYTYDIISGSSTATYGDTTAANTPTTDSEERNRRLYCVIQRYAEYDATETEPSSLNWSKCLTWKSNKEAPSDPGTYIDLGLDVLPNFRYTSGADIFVGKGGYFIIDLEFFLSECNGVKVKDDNNFATQANDEDHWLRNPEPYGHPHQSVIHNSFVFKNCRDYDKTNNTQGIFSETKIKEYHEVTLAVGNKYWNGSSWQSSPATFKIYTSSDLTTQVCGVTRKCDNNVSYKLGLADSQDGYLIPLPSDEILQGTVTFSIGPVSSFNKHYYNGDAQVMKNYQAMGRNFVTDAEFMTDLTIKYTTEKQVKDIFNLSTYDPDLVYTNEINSANITTLDDLTLTTNTYSPYATSYSYVMKATAIATDILGNPVNEYDYIGELDGKKQEERIIDKMATYYSSPRLSYSNSIKDVSANFITPFTTFSTPFNKSMVVDEISFDLKKNKAKITIKEI